MLNNLKFVLEQYKTNTKYSTMKTDFVFDNFFCPGMQEENRPIIFNRNCLNDALVSCAEIMPHIETEQRRQMTTVIETLSQVYRFMDDLHTAYMQKHEQLQEALKE